MPARITQRIAQVALSLHVVGQQGRGLFKCLQRVLALNQQGRSEDLPDQAALGVQADEQACTGLQFHIAARVEQLAQELCFVTRQWRWLGDGRGVFGFFHEGSVGSNRLWLRPWFSMMN